MIYTSIWSAGFDFDMKRIDITGLRVGRLTVISFAGKIPPRVSTWLCKCDCGRDVVVRYQSLAERRTLSCGCLASENARNRLRTHGMSGSREHNSWMAMNSRCYCESDSAYKDYGAKGIIVCDRWRHSFENFYSDMGKCKEGGTIDRIDNSKGYSPENCRWSTAKEQANNRTSNILVTWNGVVKNVSQWAEEVGVERATLLYRVKKNWPVELAMTLPPSSANKTKRTCNAM